MSLSTAIIHGTLADVNQLLRQDEEINVIDEYGYTPLIQTAICQTLDKAQALIQAGADVNFPDLTGRTALHWAVDNADIPLCKLLLENKANPNAYTIAGQPVLVTSLLRGQRSLNELLYQYKADLPFAQDFINAKVLGHRYELLGRVDIVDNTGALIEIDYEGFYLEFTLAIILNSLVRFKNNFGARHLRKWFNILKKVIQSFKAAAELIKYQNYTIDIKNHAAKINRLLNTTPLIVPVACEGHAITLIQYGKLLVRCDRGEYGRENGTVIIYRMNNPEAWTEEFIKAIIYTYQPREFIDNGIIEYLGLTPLMTLPLSPQVTGNCSWANVEAAVPATMFLLMLAENKTNLQSTWEDCQKGALYFYEEWHAWDKATALHDCIESLNGASKARQATKATLLASILFQYCNYDDVKDLDKAEKIIDVLKRPQFHYILRNYIEVFCKDTRIPEGRNFANILDHFGIDIQKFL